MTVVVEGYGDLIKDEFLNVDRADAVAQGLASGDEFVAHVPEWLFSAKGFDNPGVSGIITGTLEHETEDAYLVHTNDEDVWLPKSCSRVYEAADGADFSGEETSGGSESAA